MVNDFLMYGGWLVGALSIGAVGWGIFFGGFDKGRVKKINSLEAEKDSAAKDALHYLKEANSTLRQKYEGASQDLKTAGQRFDEATILMTKMSEENKQLKEQNTSFVEILKARDENSRVYREKTRDYQERGEKVFDIVENELQPAIIETHKIVKEKLGGEE